MRFVPASILACAVVVTPAPALAAATANQPPPAQLQWRSIGPAVSGGRVAAVAGTNRDPSLYYAGAAGGGVWKTADAGQTWKPVFDREDVASIGAIAIDPSDSGTVWVGTGEANPRNDVSQGDGVYESTDGAKTWTHVLPLRNALVSAVLIDPRDSRRVLVGVLGDPFADGTDRGVYRTVDGGKTWSKVLFAGLRTGVSDMAMNPADPETVYAGMWEFRRTGWSLQSGGDQDGVYRSTDGGATWIRLVGNGLPDGDEGRIAVAIAPSSPKRIYASIESKSGRLWRSDDGGATWTRVSSDTLANERPFYFSHLFVDPADADRLWSVSVHLTVSTDGGKHFDVTAENVHGDHHAMWIAGDGRRIVEGNDGGVAFSFDGGTHWAWDNAIPISQLYHIGYSRERPYRVCAPLQDDGVYCAPANPLDDAGISAAQWLRLGGGDGTWAEFDPRDPRLVWMSLGGGSIGGDLYVHDLSTGQTRSVAPYARDQNVVDPVNLEHRFNWETPIAFDPFDSRIAYAGGEAVFATSDRGYHWHTLGGDLTRNVRAHQVVTGGITLDGTGAETSDTVLVVAPSRAARGELWAGTDDGYVQLSRDGGVRWENVTPAGIAPFGRFASISPSVRDPATAYAVYDRHMVGDRAAYAFVTRDYGRHWHSIAAGLPGDDEARSILQDPRQPRVVYLGLERSFWMSWNGGEQWERVTGLPPASVRDIRVQPDDDDVLVATHGRGAYVLDDATPLQQLAGARAAGTYLFSVRTAVLWQLHRYSNTAFDGDAPPYGAIVTYYLKSPATRAPTAEILDARGDVVRGFAASGLLPNVSGLNRFVWDLATDGATPWSFAPAWNSGYDGVLVPPGRYAVRLRVDGRTLTQPIVVRADPRSPYSQAEYERRYAVQQVLLDDLSRVDAVLERLSGLERDRPNTPGAAQAGVLIAQITSNPANDQDDDFLTDMLRERLETLLDSFTGSFAPPTAAQLREAGDLHLLTRDRILKAELFLARVR